MEFNKMFKIFTVSAIIIMLLTTLVSACFAVSVRGNSNLGVSVVTENEKNNQLTTERF